MRYRVVVYDPVDGRWLLGVRGDIEEAQSLRHWAVESGCAVGYPFDAWHNRSDLPECFDIVLSRIVITEIA